MKKKKLVERIRGLETELIQYKQYKKYLDILVFEPGSDKAVDVTRHIKFLKEVLSYE